MNTAPASSSLQKLRAKTDRQLAVLVRRELDRGLAHVNQARPADARRSYETAEALLAMAQLAAADRVHLQENLERLREALPRCAVSAA
jgi:hypothetical protein